MHRPLAATVYPGQNIVRVQFFFFSQFGFVRIICYLVSLPLFIVYFWFCFAVFLWHLIVDVVGISWCFGMSEKVDV